MRKWWKGETKRERESWVCYLWREEKRKKEHTIKARRDKEEKEKRKRERILLKKVEGARDRLKIIK